MAALSALSGSAGREFDRLHSGPRFIELLRKIASSRTDRNEAALRACEHSPRHAPDRGESME
jgi:hypothetical protein